MTIGLMILQKHAKLMLIAMRVMDNSVPLFFGMLLKMVSNGLMEQLVTTGKMKFAHLKMTLAL
jgi:hypothetical protein